MSRVLITAFGPYDRWTENASWLALCDLTRWYDGELELVTRRYPVDLAQMSQMLRKDLQGNFSIAIHLGQSPGSTLVQLETIGINVNKDGSKLIADGPEAYRTRLPVDSSRSTLCEAGIPCEISYHAGTYMCNAAYYLSQHYAKVLQMRTQSLFIHLPLAPAQATKDLTNPASMSTPMSSAAIAILMQHLTSERESNFT